MLNAEDIIKKVEKIMKFELETGGKTQRTIQQHVGKIINHEESMLYGQTFDDMLNRVERIMKGESKNRWEGQNKLSYSEKIRKEVVKNNLKEGW